MNHLWLISLPLFSLYQVIVLPMSLQHSFNCNSQNIRDFFGHQEDTEAYITAEFIAMDVEDGMQFAVGNRLYYRDFYNAALETGKNYLFQLKIISEWNHVSWSLEKNAQKHFHLILPKMS